MQKEEVRKGIVLGRKCESSQGGPKGKRQKRGEEERKRGVGGGRQDLGPSVPLQEVWVLFSLQREDFAEFLSEGVK